MSRIGRKVINVPEGVEVASEGKTVIVKGPKGTLEREIPESITMKVDGKEISFSRPDDSNKNKALHGTTRANVANMVEGVTKGFKKNLELVGVGYRASLQGISLF
ncbi:hypothetical protein Q757_05480 [Oenococcus alcoholitolerans]|uniref:Large ribosomal subunit protein uL6 alpha-beta domain-containing protein n=1 Tax=Oenococcus alcoholitolerans TaxID=931074 RepID=A0ABR4XQH4_9LACO|nr:hypothetical protein Q757_05480 [Oenococcus alcoholitolerans]